MTSSVQHPARAGVRLMLCGGVLVALFVLVTGYVFLRSAELYAHLKVPNRGWAIRAHAFDPELGFAPIPGIRSAHTFPIGEDIPMRFSKEGFRIPFDDVRAGPARHPVVLAMGGSFTYGDAVAAEATFPFLVADALGGTELNAGVCGYGLTQMVRLADHLLAEYRPDILILQASAWLWPRAISRYADTRFGRLPTPYFVWGEQKELLIEDPVFHSALYEVPMDAFKATEPGVGDRLRFIFQVAYPLFVLDELRALRVRVEDALGQRPASAKARKRAVRLAYQQIVSRAQATGAVVVVNLIGGLTSASDTAAIQAVAGVRLVDSERALQEALRDRSEAEYSRAYHHWRGDTIVDRHPNPRAHRVIADSILNALPEWPRVEAD